MAAPSSWIPGNTLNTSPDIFLARGSVDAPPSEYVAAVERLVGGDKGKALVLYCNGPFCQASKRISEQLVPAGFTNVRRYQLGIPIWRAVGGPTEVELEGIL